LVLHPVMPFANGADGPVVERRVRDVNNDFKGLDWEIEDLLSSVLLQAFEAEYPGAVVGRKTVGGLHPQGES
jgi:hypothetical protein